MSKQMQPSQRAFSLKPNRFLKTVFFIAWVLSPQIGSLLALGIVRVLPTLNLFNNGEGGLAQAISIWILSLVIVPMLFLGGWGYFGRNDTPLRVAVEGLVGMALQVVVHAVLTGKYDPPVNALIWIWAIQVLSIAIVIILQTWYEKLRHYILLVILLAILVIVLLGESYAVTFVKAQAHEIRCSLNITLVNDLFKNIPCP